VARILQVKQIGFSRYAEARELQKQLVEQRLKDEIDDTLVITEHEAVITVGRGTPKDEIPDVGLEVIETERGGEATYHGPGQLVVYPIFKLPEGRRDLHRYLRDLEEVVIRCLAEVDVIGERRESFTGVWIGDKKVCSIGVTAKSWVTYHGFALNLRSDLDVFARFKPCGLAPGVMTNLSDHAELPPGNLLFQVLTVKHICDIFGQELPPVPDLSDAPAGSCGDGPPDSEATDEGGFPSLPIFPG
jgi:lipoyl(octanoyl) transferase